MKHLSDEVELAEYLRGGSALSRVYAELGDEQPGTRVDEAVIRAARDALQTSPTKGRRWYVPLSAAAILLLSFGLVLRMTIEPAGTVSRDTTFETGQAVPEAAPRRLPAEVRSEKARALEAAGNAKVTAGPAPVADTDRCTELAHSAASATGDRAAGQRLELIRCLRDAGDEAAAHHEITRLQKEYPQQSIPADLRDLAPVTPE